VLKREGILTRKKEQETGEIVCNGSLNNWQKVRQTFNIQILREKNGENRLARIFNIFTQ